jgi:hypothetical protein
MYNAKSLFIFLFCALIAGCSSPGRRRLGCAPRAGAGPSSELRVGLALEPPGVSGFFCCVFSSRGGGDLGFGFGRGTVTVVSLRIVRRRLTNDRETDLANLSCPRLSAAGCHSSPHSRVTPSGGNVLGSEGFPMGDSPADVSHAPESPALGLRRETLFDLRQQEAASPGESLASLPEPPASSPQLFAAGRQSFMPRDQPLSREAASPPNPSPPIPAWVTAEQQHRIQGSAYLEEFLTLTALSPLFQSGPERPPPPAGLHWQQGTGVGRGGGRRPGSKWLGSRRWGQLRRPQHPGRGWFPRRRLPATGPLAAAAPPPRGRPARAPG